MSRASALMDKPILCSFVVLELSKIHMLKQYYNLINIMFKDENIVGMQETDSILCLIKDPSNDYYAKMKAWEGQWDFSSLPAAHPLHSLKNKGKPGLMKPVFMNIKEFCGLKSKCYSLLLHCNECKADYQSRTCSSCDDKRDFVRKGRGVPRSVLRKTPHSSYTSVLWSSSLVNVKANLIRSINHNVSVIKVNRIGYHSFDVNRFFVNDTESLPFGHYECASNEQSIHSNYVSNSPCVSSLPQ